MLEDLDVAIKKLEMAGALDTKPIGQGVRKGITVCHFTQRDAEDAGQLRERMISKVNDEEIRTKHMPADRKMWAAISKPRGETEIQPRQQAPSPPSQPRPRFDQLGRMRVPGRIS